MIKKTLIIILIIIISLAFSINIRAQENGDHTTITYTPSTETHCDEDGTCWKALYSGTMFTQEPDNKWYTLSEVSNVTWENGGFNFSYRDYWVLIEPFVVYNGIPRTIQEIKDAFPNVNLKDYAQPSRFNHKFAINYSNVPQNLIDNVNYMGFRIKDSGGLTWDDVRKTGNHSIVIKNKVEISYYDLVQSGFTINLINRTTLLIGNISNNYENGVVYLDPIIKLVSTSNNAESVSFNDEAGGFNQNSTFQAKFNISSIAGNVITSAKFFAFLIEVDGSGSNMTNVYNVVNQSWIKDLDCHSYFSQTTQNMTSNTWSSITNNTWSSINVTTQVKEDHDKGNENTTIRFELQSSILTDDTHCTNYNDVVELQLGRSLVGNANPFTLRFDSPFETPNNPPYLNITYSSVSDTCTYSSGDWNIDCSDMCNITSDVAIDTSDLNITGTGTGYVYINATISGFTNGRIENCPVTCETTNCFQLG